MKMFVWWKRDKEGIKGVICIVKVLIILLGLDVMKVNFRVSFELKFYNFRYSYFYYILVLLFVK